MNNIKTMLQDQKSLKTVILFNYYENERIFLQDAKSYLQYCTSDEEKIELDLLINTIINGTQKNLFYLDYEVEDSPNYVRSFQLIIKEYFKNRDIAYRKATDIWSTRKKMDSAINSFSKRFINSQIYMPIIMDIAINMEQRLNNKKNNSYVKKGALSYSVDKNVINDIYESGMSLLDYAFYNSIDYSLYNNYFSSCKNTREDILEICNRENTVEDKIISIIQMINSEELDIFDYYKLCKLKLPLLGRFASKYNLTSPIFSNFLKNSSQMTLGKIQINKLYSDQLIINDYVVPIEIKKQAIDYLESIGAPITYNHYKEIIRRLIDEKNVIKR